MTFLLTNNKGLENQPQSPARFQISHAHKPIHGNDRAAHPVFIAVAHSICPDLIQYSAPHPADRAIDAN